MIGQSSVDTAGSGSGWHFLRDDFYRIEPSSVEGHGARMSTCRLHIPEGVLEDQQQNDAVEALDLLLDAISEEVRRHAELWLGRQFGSLASIAATQDQSQDASSQHLDLGRYALCQRGGGTGFCSLACGQ